MTEILLERNRHLYYEYFNIDERKFFRKRLSIALIFFLLISALTFKTGNLWFIAGIPILMFIGFKLPYAELVSKKSEQDLIKQYEFPTFLRYFLALLGTQGNVYQTLKATVPYTNDPIRSELEKLIKKLEDNNVQNREAFIEFAESIGSGEAYMIMDMIFEFHEEGISKEELKELETTINKLQENRVNELIEYKVNRMGIHANPIIIYGLIFIFLFTGITLISYLTLQDLGL